MEKLDMEIKARLYSDNLCSRVELIPTIWIDRDIGKYGCWRYELGITLFHWTFSVAVWRGFIE